MEDNDGKEEIKGNKKVAFDSGKGNPHYNFSEQIDLTQGIDSPTPYSTYGKREHGPAFKQRSVARITVGVGAMIAERKMKKRRRALAKGREPKQRGPRKLHEVDSRVGRWKEQARAHTEDEVRMSLEAKGHT
ncbi:uncharacterized protein PAC_16748 [Phialocephala subalpina]|uniref:Uncharacterized protein n=1 Tax=Phialocephala subalpina TaxID=576137 RepID=A0A1L7XPF2_9HELO|nr:uncharacterized protein PAC_16748 [Phialocephala subalpina]